MFGADWIASLIALLKALRNWLSGLFQPRASRHTRNEELNGGVVAPFPIPPVETPPSSAPLVRGALSTAVTIGQQIDPSLLLFIMLRHYASFMANTAACRYAVMLVLLVFTVCPRCRHQLMGATAKMMLRIPDSSAEADQERAVYDLDRDDLTQPTLKPMVLVDDADSLQQFQRLTVQLEPLIEALNASLLVRDDAPLRSDQRPNNPAELFAVAKCIGFLAAPLYLASQRAGDATSHAERVPTLLNDIRARMEELKNRYPRFKRAFISRDPEYCRALRTLDTVPAFEESLQFRFGKLHEGVQRRAGANVAEYRSGHPLPEITPVTVFNAANEALLQLQDAFAKLTVPKQWPASAVSAIGAFKQACAPAETRCQLNTKSVDFESHTPTTAATLRIA